MGNEDMILKVLGEVLEELQTANKSLKKTEDKLGELETRVQAFEHKEIRIDPPDLAPVTERVSAECAAIRKETSGGLLRVAATVEAQPKPIVRRISLFPENDTQRNYRTTIWAIVAGILGTAAIAGAYVLFNAWILRIHPERAVSSLSMPPYVDSATAPKTVLPPPKRAGTAIPHGQTKKSGKKVDTLNYNSIYHIIDSLRQKIIDGR